MNKEDKKFAIGISLVAIVLVGAIAWFGFVYVPNHYAHEELMITEGRFAYKYEYVENGNIYILVVLEQTPKPPVNVTLTVKLDLRFLEPNSIIELSRAKFGDKLTITRNYLCGGYNPHSITRYWIRGCELQTVTVQLESS